MRPVQDDAQPWRSPKMLLPGCDGVLQGFLHHTTNILLTRIGISRGERQLFEITHTNATFVLLGRRIVKQTCSIAARKRQAFLLSLADVTTIPAAYHPP
jgi:hypothetical protein